MLLIVAIDNKYAVIDTVSASVRGRIVSLHETREQAIRAIRKLASTKEATK